MSSVWSDQWPLASINNTPDSNSCYNNTHSTVFNGDQFGGVPLVLLLNFCVFLVRLCSYHIKWCIEHRQKIHLFQTPNLHCLTKKVKLKLLTLSG